MAPSVSFPHGDDRSLLARLMAPFVSFRFMLVSPIPHRSCAYLFPFLLAIDPIVHHVLSLE
jgi:hypothetical protein